MEISPSLCEAGLWTFDTKHFIAEKKQGMNGNKADIIKADPESCSLFER